MSGTNWYANKGICLIPIGIAQSWSSKLFLVPSLCNAYAEVFLQIQERTGRE